MTKEQQQRLEQKAEKYAGDIRLVTEHVKVYNAYFDGAQTILDNPSEWGLCPVDWYKNKRELHRNQVYTILQEHSELESQLSRYRSALDKIAAIGLDTNHELIAKEALKEEQK